METFTAQQQQKNTIQQVITMLVTSKDAQFPGHNHLLTTGTDDPTLRLSPERQQVYTPKAVVIDNHLPRQPLISSYVPDWLWNMLWWYSFPTAKECTASEGSSVPVVSSGYDLEIGHF